mgnify:CR=1 FL=1
MMGRPPEQPELIIELDNLGRIIFFHFPDFFEYSYRYINNYERIMVDHFRLLTRTEYYNYERDQWR